MPPRPQVALAPLTTLGVGGAAQWLARIGQETELPEALAWAKTNGLEVHILGGGSNLVVADAGLPGLVLQMATTGTQLTPSGPGTVELTAAAGESWDGLVQLAVQQGLAGIECLSGIPGLVGATPIQNVGAYGQEVAETIQRVRAWDRETGQTVELQAEDCHFRYRDSRFKGDEPNRFVVLDVTFRLQQGARPSLRYAELARQLDGATPPSLAQVRETVIRIRRSKSMVLDAQDPNTRSAGSFFTNPIVTSQQADRIAQLAGAGQMPRYPQPDGRVKLSAAWLIQQAGFEPGFSQGPVGLSSRHTLAIVCHAGASAQAVVTLAHTIRQGVEQRFGVRLVPEPNFWGFTRLADGLPVLTD